jgi:pimeloyl-ACP methyl ester carboxylesterase
MIKKRAFLAFFVGAVLIGCASESAIDENHILEDIMKMEHKQLESMPIHYFMSDETDKPILLFVHPAFADHRTFNKQVEYFSNRYRIITIDLIGHGLSQKIKTKSGIECSSEHIKEILDIERIDKVHLIGVSIGSLIVQDFANKYPAQVLSLCSLGGYDINNYDKSIEKQQRKQQLSFMAKALISMKWFSKSNALQTVQTPEAQNDFYQMNLLFKRSSFRYLTKLGDIMNRYETVDRNYPLLILSGEGDVPLAIELAKKWNADEKDSNFLIIQNAGHCANMDNPDEFNKALEIFINSADK